MHKMKKKLQKSTLTYIKIHHQKHQTIETNPQHPDSPKLLIQKPGNTLPFTPI
jgi:hypothetical protein